MDHPAQELVMMYSGGVDTTLAAARLLEDDPARRLHLLTFCNGYCIRVGSSAVHVKELQALYGTDRVVHEIIYVTEIFEALRRPLWDLVRRYRSTLVVDLCCRLSMESAAIIYALEQGLTQICDGTNIDQGRLFLERPRYLQVAKDFFAEHGINYFSPVYGRMEGRYGRIERLRRRGITVGPRQLERININSSIMHQPFCLIGIHTFFFTSFVRDLPLLRRIIAHLNLELERAVEARLDRQEVARRLIRERTREAHAVGEGFTVAEHFCTTRLCGENGVEIRLPRGAQIELSALESRWRETSEGTTRRGEQVLTLKIQGLEVEAHARGRVVVRGTRDRDRAETAYRRWVADLDVVQVDCHGAPPGS